jgi:SAM-dependent methyltransferase
MTRASGNKGVWLRERYRSIIPKSVRSLVRKTIFFARPSYSLEYYNYIESLQARSYTAMANTIVDLFRPRTVIDVGCGSGGLLEALGAHGNDNVRCQGVEFSKAGRRLCRRRGVGCEFGDLTKPLSIAPHYDLLLCFEVAEHLPSQYADQLVKNLTSGPKRVVFSAATPGQGGQGHVNEQPNEYWIQKFDARGFGHNRVMSDAMRMEWSSQGVVGWFATNVMVFEGKVEMSKGGSERTSK